VRKNAQKNAQRGKRGSRDIRPSLRGGVTAYAALFPETNSFCLRRLAN